MQLELKKAILDQHQPELHRKSITIDDLNGQLGIAAGQIHTAELHVGS